MQLSMIGDCTIKEYRCTIAKFKSAIIKTAKVMVGITLTLARGICEMGVPMLN